MTGSLFELSYTGTTSLPGRSPLRGSAYSIDSFAEYSSQAVSRTPTTLTAHSMVYERVPTSAEQDEELLRDLFANENDGDGDPAQTRKPSRKARSHVQPRAAVWAAAFPTFSTYLRGSGGHIDSGGQRLDSFEGSSRATITSSTITTSGLLPTLSAPAPRPNLTELINARPSAILDANLWSGELGRVEEAEEELEELMVPQVNDDDDCPQTTARSPRQRSLLGNRKAAPSTREKQAQVQQETLSFLEKLDLKTLLHTPRPDVLQYYPSMATTPFLASSNAINYHDARVEEDNNNHGTQNTTKRAGAGAGGGGVGLAPQIERPLVKAMSKDARLAYMELTYGTSKGETRRTRKETLERLANPIVGYTSTLQALAPDQRRKRESRDEFPALALSEQLAKSASIYEAAASLNNKTSSGNGNSTRRGGGKRAGRKAPKKEPRRGNNQLDAEDHDRKRTSRDVNKADSSLRQSKQQPQDANNQLDLETSSSMPYSSTFLTQLGEHDNVNVPLRSAKSATKTTDPLVPRRPAPPTTARLTRGGSSNADAIKPRRPNRAIKDAVPARDSGRLVKGTSVGKSTKASKLVAEPKTPTARKRSDSGTTTVVNTNTIRPTSRPRASAQPSPAPTRPRRKPQTGSGSNGSSATAAATPSRPRPQASTADMLLMGSTMNATQATVSSARGSAATRGRRTETTPHRSKQQEPKRPTVPPARSAAPSTRKAASTKKPAATVSLPAIRSRNVQTAQT
ncbi:TPA: hypothetical protein N0F65_012264 [Lagenidium giganteum]|uniref:Uncharacterized protein n=1 Tax=Lagenidium giganteum TaxID=4803 RepID=A0AAV2ZEU0_9STRA|nr:TPA: hypothetical protein N0F65_012264 [Lagenidium giganteum]